MINSAGELDLRGNPLSEGVIGHRVSFAGDENVLELGSGYTTM